jgi:hypothetical protein
LGQAIRDLRNTQVAHSLIPWEEPADHVWSTHLLDFAERIFDFVVKIETHLAEPTGVSLTGRI